MATNEKYLNYYIETLTSTLNDCVVRNVSMQANARISNELVEEQQQKIEELENLLKSIKEDSGALNNKLIEDIKKLTTEINELRTIRNQYENIKSEATHVETFRNELVKEREAHNATRTEMQIKVNNITNDFNNRINKLTVDHNDKLNRLNIDHNDKLNKLSAEHNEKLKKMESENTEKVNKLNSKYKKEIESLNSRITYLEMSPSKRKKFDMMNNPASTESEKIDEETNKDGGVF